MVLVGLWGSARVPLDDMASLPPPYLQSPQTDKYVEVVGGGRDMGLGGDFDWGPEL